jgi:hypothetical protein
MVNKASSMAYGLYRVRCASRAISVTQAGRAGLPTRCGCANLNLRLPEIGGIPAFLRQITGCGRPAATLLPFDARSGTTRLASAFFSRHGCRCGASFGARAAFPEWKGNDHEEG